MKITINSVSLHDTLDRYKVPMFTAIIGIICEFIQIINSRYMYSLLGRPNDASLFIIIIEVLYANSMLLMMLSRRWKPATVICCLAILRDFILRPLGIFSIRLLNTDSFICIIILTIVLMTELVNSSIDKQEKKQREEV